MKNNKKHQLKLPQEMGRAVLNCKPDSYDWSVLS